MLKACYNIIDDVDDDDVDEYLLLYDFNSTKNSQILSWSCDKFHLRLLIDEEGR